MIDFKHREQIGEFLNSLNLNGKGAEIGTFKGEFSKKILNSWGGKLYMVDVWRPLSDDEYDDMSNHRNHIDAYSKVIDNIQGFEDRAFMLRMKGEYASELFEDESLDFVYIDANHTYQGVKDDIKLWFPKVKKGGLLLGHDYLPSVMYKDGDKDIPVYLSYGDVKNKYAGMFGVNPAVNEFVEEYGYGLKVTEEDLGTWWIIK